MLTNSIFYSDAKFEKPETQSLSELFKITQNEYQKVGNLSEYVTEKHKKPGQSTN